MEIQTIGIKDTSHLSFNEGRQRQVVEQVREVLPHTGIAVLAQTFIIETVHLSYLPALVVTTQDRDTIFEPHLEQAWLLSLPESGCIFMLMGKV